MGQEKNFTDLGNIDKELTEQGVRYPVYAWVEKDGYYAKFEQFLGDFKDFSKFPGGFTDAATRNEVIKRIAGLHSANVIGTDQNKHRNPATTWWNTYLVNYHFGQLFYALETYGDPDAFYAKLGWTKEQLQAEIDFTEKTLQTYYDANPERAVICHNDVHQGNVMRNKDGEVQLDSIILVDFDQAGYGFRMWDILYFLSNLGELPTDEIINESLQVYLDTQTYEPDLKLETLQAEFLNHFPYFALERMSFLMGMIPDLSQDFADVLKGVYGYSISQFGRELPTSSYLLTIISLPMLICSVLTIF